MKYFKDYLAEITLEEITQYYEIENHTAQECLEHFNIGQAMFFRVLKHYGFKKSKEAQQEHIKRTKELRYGDANYNNRVKATETNLERYGVENPFQADTVKEKIKQTTFEKYGVDHIMYLEETKEKVQSKRNMDEIYRKASQTYFERTGYYNPRQNPEVVAKSVQTRNDTGRYTNIENTKRTCQERYGVDFTCQRPEARIAGSDSKPNLYFASLLDKYGIEYEREFNLENRSYDFKIGNILVEINPTATHNATWHPFSKNRAPLNKFYHRDKTVLANKHGFSCIHIFDWDDIDKIINQLFIVKERVYARKCVIKEVPRVDAISFLNTYHLQNYARDSIRLGLYYNDELVSLMTFGKPRYNKNYEYELIRYASNKAVVGGAERLFKHFLEKYSVKSVISYNDKAKFTGNVYSKLNFVLKEKLTKPSKHWYNINTEEHYTDNLIRQQGFSRVVNKINYTEDTSTGSNDELLIANDFVSIYDVGQDTYTFNL